MSRVSRSAFAALAVAAVAACSDSPVDNAAAIPSSLVSANANAPEQVVAGEVIMKSVDGASVADIARAHGLSVGERGYGNAFVVLHGAAGAERANARALAADSRVVYAEPNYLRQIDVDPKLWAFYNPGGLNMNYTSGANKGKPISASYASVADADEDNIDGYAAGATGTVVVGSIDTGVDFNHPEFKNADGSSRLIAGKDWYSNDNDPSDTDDHGSHTSGTMAGKTVGVAGVAGVAANVKIYVQRVCGQRGCPTTAIVNAIRAAADYGVVAMNLSIGGGSLAQSESDAIAYANSKNAIVIASAGNDGSGTVACPACDPGAISVASTQWQDKLASYSQYGPGLDISAPGGNCYSNTTPEGCIYSSIRGGAYGWMQGTSMAAPQVTGTAGVVALVTGLRGSALRSRLESTTDDLGAPGYDQTFGNGRLNSYRAVTGSSLPAGQ
jgi:serine protease